MSKSAMLGLLSGLAVIVFTLIAVALVNLPEAEGAVSPSGSGCQTVQVAQDQGYGLTRNVQRDVCVSAR